MGLVRELRDKARSFFCDEAGTAGLEFVTTVPLLLGVLVFTAEYGEALRARMALDSALQDIGRYLARAPTDSGVAEDGQTQTITFYPGVIAEATALLQQRIDVVNQSNGDPYFEINTYTVDPGSEDGGTFRDPYFVVEVVTATWEELPLLSLINGFSSTSVIKTRQYGIGTEDGFGDSSVPLGLILYSRHAVRWIGGAAPGEADCRLGDRYQGLCP